MEWTHSSGWKEKEEPHDRGKERENIYSLVVQCHSFLLQAFEGPSPSLLSSPLSALSVSLWRLISLEGPSLSAISLQSSQPKYLDSLCSNSCSWQMFSATFFRERALLFIYFRQAANVMRKKSKERKKFIYFWSRLWKLKA